MANSAPLPDCFMLVHEWTALLCVTLKAAFVSTEKSKSAGFECLLNVCRSALRGDSFVRLMTIAAAHLAFRHGMMMRQLECRAYFQVTLETGFRRLPWIDNRASAAAGLDMQAPRTMA
jgi:hypothetical protein